MGKGIKGVIIKTVDLRSEIIGLGYVDLPLAIEFGKQRCGVEFNVNQEGVD